MGGQQIRNGGWQARVEIVRGAQDLRKRQVKRDRDGAKCGSSEIQERQKAYITREQIRCCVPHVTCSSLQGRLAIMTRSAQLTFLLELKRTRPYQRITKRKSSGNVTLTNVAYNV